jgi:hypothetical protein
MTRVLQAARLHLVNPLVILGIPWLIVGVSFAVNIAVWHLTPAGEADGSFSGGVLALYFTVLVVYAQAVTQLLPFAMGVGLSRRAFYLGTTVVAVVQALLYGLALAVLAALERATGGWGTNLDFWAPGPFAVGNVALQILVYAAPMLAFMFVGISLGVTQKRWGPAGVWGVMIGALLAVGLLAVLFGWLGFWAVVWGWLTEQTLVTLAVGLPVALGVAFAAFSYAGIRHVVP